MDQKQEPKSSTKLNALAKIEKDVQSKWKKDQAFEIDAPEEDDTGAESNNQNKYMATFSYPCMNGRLHLGDALALSKAEFAVGYEKLKGKRCLLPFAFHCTGMAIKACADKLKDEMEKFEFPPKFPEENKTQEACADKPKDEMKKPESSPEENKAQEETSRPKACADKPKDEMKERESSPEENKAQEETSRPKACADKSKDEMKKCQPSPEENKAQEETSRPKKKKVSPETCKTTYQWTIMKEQGLSDNDIKSLTDPQTWLKYFPPLIKEDLEALGIKVDWRRSFITTDANPYYDSFVRWQFIKLKERNKIKFGKIHTIFSPLEDQPSMDYDWELGNYVRPQEYTLIKMQVVEPFPKKLRPLAGQPVFLVAATLRPETMYGQTNCWLHPSISYIAFRIKTGEVFVSTWRAALNMAYQDFTAPFGKLRPLLKFKGEDLMGIALKAPLTSYEVIYTLPMFIIKEDRGTGVAVSVPSDDPTDYAALQDVQKKEPLRKKFAITDEMVPKNIPAPIVKIPNNSAIDAYEKYKVTSQNDQAQLEKAKEELERDEGVLTVGPHAGKKVQEAKKLIQAEMVASGEAVLYQEPERTVISRSGDQCVVALTDQWYLDYGEPEWKESVRDILNGVRMYPDSEVKTSFNTTLDGLTKHVCSRVSGLGTLIPWDPQFMIESLSDSTIYMAYYTVSYLLQGGVVNGSTHEPLVIRPEQMTDTVWDYVFYGGDLPQSDIHPDALKKLRWEFSYWYPVDLQVSGKDLIQNHLTYSLYNHQAIWPQPSREGGEGVCRWPNAIRASGHLLLNSEKMAMSTGHFRTLTESIKRFSADGTRLYLADAGDGLKDIKFGSADDGLLRLYSHLEWVQRMFKAHKQKKLRCDPPDNYTYHDRVFANRVNHLIQLTDRNYAATMYKEALKTGFYDLQDARKSYEEFTASSEGVNWNLINRFIKVQALLLCPICPHVTEHIWGKHLKESGSIMSAQWPAMEEGVDEILLKEVEYLKTVSHKFRVCLKKWKSKQLKRSKSSTVIPHLEYGVVCVAQEYLPWQRNILMKLKELYNEDENSLPEDEVLREQLLDDLNRDDIKDPIIKKRLLFVQSIKELLPVKGCKALEGTPCLDEKLVLQKNLNYLTRTLDLKEMWIENASESDIGNKCKVGDPIPHFRNIPYKRCAQVPVAVVTIPIYDEDTYATVVDRIYRTSGIPGHVLHRYVKDACSIPVAGDGSEQAIIGCNSTFTISGGDSLLLRDSGKEPKCIAHLHE